MTDENTTEKAPAQPSHIAYQVRESADGKSYFNRVGAAYPHKDGNGFNLKLESMPVDGRVTLRSPLERLTALDERETKPRSNSEPDR
jgi:hypothetical protein